MKLFTQFSKRLQTFQRNTKKRIKPKINNTYYKFGDGDYLLFKNEKLVQQNQGLGILKNLSSH